MALLAGQRLRTWTLSGVGERVWTGAQRPAQQSRVTPEQVGRGPGQGSEGLAQASTWHKRQVKRFPPGRSVCPAPASG